MEPAVARSVKRGMPGASADSSWELLREAPLKKGHELKGTAGRIATGLLATLLLGAASGRALPGDLKSAPAPGAASLSPADLREGTRGTAYTVFHGDQPTPFPIEILGVLTASRPKGDLIVFKALGDSLAESGIMAGMSGSPVYVNGRIIGAIAFAFPFAKEAIGMITPIGEMREGMSRTDEPPAPWAGIAADVYQPMLRSFLTRSVDSSIWDRMIPEVPQTAGVGARLISLCGSGWAQGMESALEGFSQRTGLQLLPASGAEAWSDVRGGSIGASSNSSSAGNACGLVPGSAIGVALIAGDAALSAIGTLTERDGDHFVAFGHPLFQAGPVALPVTSARILAVVPSLNNSFKVGSTGPVIGTIRQDLRAGISGNFGEVPPMLPVRVVVNGPAGGETYHYRIARGYLLEPTMLAWVVNNSFLQHGWRLGEATVDGRLTFHYNKTQVLVRRDRVTTKSPATEIAEQLLGPIPVLLSNPFKPVIADSVAIEVNYSTAARQSALIDFYAERARIRAGERLSLTARLQNYQGETREFPIEVPIPERWRGKNLLIIAGGIQDLTEWDKDRAPILYEPKEFSSLERMIREFPDAGDLVIRIYGEGEGVVLGDREMGPLPASIASVLGAGHKRGPAQTAPNYLLEERKIDAGGVVSGGIGVRVRVE